GNLWIGTRSSGVSVFRWEDESFLRLGSIMPAGEIWDLTLTDDNNMLVAIEGVGLALYQFNTEDFKVYTTNSGRPNSIASTTNFSIVKGGKNRYWLGSSNNGVDLFDLSKETFQFYDLAASFGQEEIRRRPLLLDSKGYLWIGSDGKGIAKLDIQTKSATYFNTSNSDLHMDIVTSLYEDDEGQIYIGSDGKGIAILDPKSLQFDYITSSLLDSKSLSSNAIYDIYEDDAGMIWISTFRGGVNTYSRNREKFRLYKQIPFAKNSLSFASIVDVLAGNDGSIWIGTDGGGLDKLNPQTGEFEHYKNDPNNINSLSTNVAIALREDSKGNLWVGTYAGGVNRIDTRTGNIKRFLPDPNDPRSINSKNVWDILEDSRGTLWFGLLNGGLDKYDHETESFTHYTSSSQSNSISSNLVYLLLEDSRSNFWIGTEDGGLNLFDREREVFTRYTHSAEDTTSLFSNNIRCLFEDKKNQLWIGTSLGLNLMDIETKTITRSKINALLPSQVINGIEQDKDGNLWISTNQGISKYDIKTKSIQNFGKTDGLQGNEFNYNSSTVSSDGTMYFGGVSGLNAFQPSSVKTSNFQPNVVITDIKLFDVTVTSPESQTGQYHGKSIAGIDNLELNHDQNVIEVNFSSLDFTSPKVNQYRYRLEGFDKDWVSTSADKRYASYTNLDAGDYTLHIEATNSDGIWSPNKASLSITIHQPWWNTWWFKSIAFLVVAGIALSIIRWRTLSIKAQKEALKKEVEMATSQMKERNQMLNEEQEKLTEAVRETNDVL
ncbi:MAG: hypothetical protein HRT61_22830, partial [Ekhidna sp.]|nr:hypothetical protein [Ekhidna sp.]